MEMLSSKQKDDLLLLQVRLFRLFQLNMNIDAQECSRIFNEYQLYDYIETCYEFFHIQGDDANYSDIINYLKNKGFKI